jgi:HAMP domain-containing protein
MEIVTVLVAVAAVIALVVSLVLGLRLRSQVQQISNLSDEVVQTNNALAKTSAELAQVNSVLAKANKENQMYQTQLRVIGYLEGFDRNFEAVATGAEIAVEPWSILSKFGKWVARQVVNKTTNHTKRYRDFLIASNPKRPTQTQEHYDQWIDAMYNQDIPILESYINERS